MERKQETDPLRRYPLDICSTCNRMDDDCQRGSSYVDDGKCGCYLHTPTMPVLWKAMGEVLLNQSEQSSL